MHLYFAQFLNISLLQDRIVHITRIKMYLRWYRRLEVASESFPDVQIRKHLEGKMFVLCTSLYYLEVHTVLVIVVSICN